MDISVTLTKESRSYKGKKTGYWFLRWHGSDGSRHKQSIGRIDDLSKRLAEKKRQAKQNELEAQPGRRDMMGSPELGPYIQGYLAARKGEVRQGTLELHEQTGRYLIGHFGEKRRLDTITKLDARDFKMALAEGKLSGVNKRPHAKPPEASTVDRHVREARTIFGRAFEDEVMTSNPFAKLRAATYVPKEWHYVDASEFAKLMEAGKPEWRLMLGLARWAGLRAEETLELPWRAVHFDRRRLDITPRTDWQPKDGESRTLPISPELLALLREARDGDPSGQWVVPRGSIPIKNIWRDFGPLCKRAGIARYAKPMHALRKSCITDWAKVNAGHVVQAWAGHSDYRTTSRYYLKVSEGDFDRASGPAQKPAQNPDSYPSV